METTLTVEVTILMPCLNEAETLATCIRKARQFLQTAGVTGEVLIADNGSTDGSRAIAVNAGARVVVAEERGYGNALMRGIAAAQGTYIIMADSDDSYDFTALAPFLERLRAGDDLVMGNRFRGGIKPGAMPPLNRTLGNPLLSWMGRLFFGSRCGDFYCGLRGIRKAVVEKMDLRTTGMEFAIEMVVKATLLGLRVSEVPTILSPDGRSHPPHLRPWRDGWRTVRFFLIYSPRWLFLYPGILLMFVGLLVGVWLLPRPRVLGNVTVDVQTLLYAAMAALIGFQAVSFAAFTKVFSISEGLLPEPPRLIRVFRMMSLEVGLAIGGILIVGGLFGSFRAVSEWAVRSFGPLNTSETLRLVIPAITLLVLGCQVVLSSFFISILWLRRNRSGRA